MAEGEGRGGDVPIFPILELFTEIHHEQIRKGEP